MLKKIVAVIFTALICYSSSSLADSCGHVYDEELGWLNEVGIASGQSEPMNEVPVPVTVINSQMIKDIGAKNLKDVLITYVPGITFVQDRNDVNVAGHGVYSTAQEKMLILLNGHRLNSRAMSEAQPDYGISLEKVECIEVLRAPGSSLYGNVALTAVINIITKKGTDMGGTEVSIGFGNYGQRKLSFVHGNEFENGKSDLLLWGTYYKSDGETVNVTKDYSREQTDSPHAILDGFNDPASYDIGINYEFGDFTLLATQRYSKYIEPFSTHYSTKYSGESYNYTDYRTLRGIGPGKGSKSSHLGLDYVKEFDSLNLQFQIYYDENESYGHIITNPSEKEHDFLEGNEQVSGFIAQLSKPYNLIGDSGTWMIGTQMDRMEMHDADFIQGRNGEWIGFTDTRGRKFVDIGKETIFSGFLQIKHRFNDQWIGNFGARYDRKKRHTSDDIDNLSPRLAIIWIPNEKFDLKVSYSRKAFVDAPYFQRYSSLSKEVQGSESLEPEYMQAFQLTPTIKLADGKTTSSFNFFYNKFSDVIQLDDKNWVNAGFLKVWGIENETTYREKAYNMAFNFTYQAADGAENYAVSGDRIHNVPNWTTNVVFNVNPFKLFDVKSQSVSDDLWLNLTARYVGEQLSPITSEFRDKDDSNNEVNEVDNVILFNTGFRWENLWKGFFLDGRIYNLLDEKYYQGGSVSHPYPQPGRWFMLTVGYQGDW
jgi:outer membrane receptor for ferrienterochelin and colicins